ncbi:Cell division suppressor protein YneA [compost metagenome]
MYRLDNSTTTYTPARYRHRTTVAPTPKPKRIRITAIVIFITTAISLGALQSIAQQPALAQSVEWTVRYHATAGDTLWEIAQTVPGYEQHDMRELVHIIKQHNNMNTSAVYVGQGITLPTTWEVQ